MGKRRPWAKTPIALPKNRKACVYCSVKLTLENITRRNPPYAICNKCNAKRVSVWQNENIDRYRLSQRMRNRDLKIETIKEYGGRCACCSETDINLLCIDHVFGGGGKERKKTGSGTRFYNFLKRNKYPKEKYQVLCYNCNYSKRDGDLCSHQKFDVFNPSTWPKYISPNQ